MNVSLFLMTPVAMLVGLVVYRLVRRYSTVTVNCWFCCRNDVVPYRCCNSWDCKSCGQYNGFNDEGDYNKPIPTMFSEHLNHSPVKRSPSSQDAEGYSSEGQRNSLLCVTCSQNQQLKIRQLANFVPHREADFEIEVEAYRHHLEQIYRLCRQCDVAVRHELSRQDLLIRRKMFGAGLLYSESTVNASPSRLSASDLVLSHAAQNSTRRSGFMFVVLRLMAVLCSLTLLIASVDFALFRSVESPLSPILVELLRAVRRFSGPIVALGTFAELAAVYMAGSDKLHVIDAFVCFTWLLNMLTTALLDTHEYSSSAHHLLLTRCLLTAICFLLSLGSVFVARQPAVVARRRASQQMHHNLFQQKPSSASVDHDISEQMLATCSEPDLLEDTPVVDRLGTMNLGAPSKLQSSARSRSFLSQSVKHPVSRTTPMMSTSLRQRPLVSPPKLNLLTPAERNHRPSKWCKSSNLSDTENVSAQTDISGRFCRADEHHTKVQSSRPDIIGSCDSDFFSSLKRASLR